MPCDENSSRMACALLTEPAFPRPAVFFAMLQNLSNRKTVAKLKKVTSLPPHKPQINTGYFAGNP